MITLAETLDDQRDLVDLCQDRALVTNEIFRPNAFYGMDRILKGYVGLPASYSLKCTVHHGINFGEDRLSDEIIQAPLPAVLCYPPYREHVYVEKTNKVVVQSASPFLYFLELLRQYGVPNRQKREGTIFFPSHSTGLVTATMDYDRIAKELIGLKKEYQPVTVCMYWRDYNLGRYVPFRNQGLKIVSAGHRADPSFLYRLYHLCSLHRYAASNSLGSHIFYAVKAGCSFFFLDTDIEVSSEGDPHHLKQHTSPASDSRKTTLRALFDNPTPCPTEEQLETVDYYLGAACLKSPQALGRQLMQFEFLDKFGILVKSKGMPSKIVLPAFYKRRIEAMQKIVQTYLPKFRQKYRQFAKLGHKLIKK